MNLSRNAAILFGLVGLIVAIGCSSDKAPTVPGAPSRAGADFLPYWPLFSSLAIDYNEIDLAPLLYAWTSSTGDVAIM
jgi:hypothetical protein